MGEKGGGKGVCAIPVCYSQVSSATLSCSSPSTMSVESRFFNLVPIIKWPFEVEHLDAIMLLSKAPDLRYGDYIPMPIRLFEHVGPPAFLVPISRLSQTGRMLWWPRPWPVPGTRHA